MIATQSEHKLWGFGQGENHRGLPWSCLEVTLHFLLVSPSEGCQKSEWALPSLCSLLFQPRHPLQMVKENPPLRKRDKASNCHEVFPKQCLIYGSPGKVVATDSESPEKTWAVYFSQGPTVIWVIRQFWKSLVEGIQHEAGWWKVCVLFQPLPLTRCRIWISFNVSESELSCL